MFHQRRKLTLLGLRVIVKESEKKITRFKYVILLMSIFLMVFKYN